MCFVGEKNVPGGIGDQPEREYIEQAATTATLADHIEAEEEPHA
jgi:hypothetical protein